jgi:nucleotide-binding universal stress UspA family protein
MIILKNVLHPTDFSENSEPALKYACSVAIQFNADLHLINVVQDFSLLIPVVTLGFPPDYYQKQLQHANETLAELPQRVISHSGNVIRNVCEGKPVAEIIRYTKENAIDMIVMGTHGYTGLEHAVLGSVAEAVVRHAPCPVLTVRPEKARTTILY